MNWIEIALMHGVPIVFLVIVALTLQLMMIRAWTFTASYRLKLRCSEIHRYQMIFKYQLFEQDEFRSTCSVYDFEGRKLVDHPTFKNWWKANTPDQGTWNSLVVAFDARSTRLELVSGDVVDVLEFPNVTVILGSLTTIPVRRPV